MWGEIVRVSDKKYREQRNVETSYQNGYFVIVISFKRSSLWYFCQTYTLIPSIMDLIKLKHPTMVKIHRATKILPEQCHVEKLF